jgi:uncharacterized membrane protein YgdD (TMEM256/DUF423 family)
MKKLWFFLAGVNGAIAVLLGAFGFHNFREAMAAHEFAVYSLGSQFHLVHAVVLLGIAMLVDQNVRLARRTGLAIIVGTALFSGALYGNRFLGPFTELAPIGLLFLLVGWILIGAMGLRRFE